MLYGPCSVGDLSNIIVGKSSRFGFMLSDRIDSYVANASKLTLGQYSVAM